MQQCMNTSMMMPVYFLVLSYSFSQFGIPTFFSELRHNIRDFLMCHVVCRPACPIQKREKIQVVQTCPLTWTFDQTINHSSTGRKYSPLQLFLALPLISLLFFARNTIKLNVKDTQPLGNTNTAMMGRKPKVEIGTTNEY